MKKYTLFSVLLLFVSFSNGAIAAYNGSPNINLVQNSSFEARTITDSDGDIPVNWNVSHSGGVLSEFGISSYHHHSMKHSAYIFDDNYANGLGLVSDKIAITPGYAYHARAFLRKDNSQIFTMNLQFYDANDIRIQIDSSRCTSIYSFEEENIVATAPPNAIYARIQFYVWADPAGGYFWIDSVSLILADERISNGTFANSTPPSLPEHWEVYTTHSGATQGTYSNNGDNVLQLTDVSSTSSSSVFKRIPVTGGVPYKLTCDARKLDGTGNVGLYLKFYDKNDQQLASYSTYTGSSTWTNLSITQKAPLESVYGKIICYSFAGTTGESWFDNFSFRENYILKFASPNGAGNNDGSSSTNAAIYNSSQFLSDIDSAAINNPVKVILIKGDYSEHWSLTGIGNNENQIVFEAQYPFETNFVAEGMSPDDYITITNAKNLLFRHLHFTRNDETIIPYIVRILGTAVSVKNIAIQGCSFIDINSIEYGIISIAGSSIQDIILEYCTWIRVGNDVFDHCIYAANSAKKLTINYCYFEDCTGTYVRFRNRAEGNVENSTFTSTGLIATADYAGRVHWPFIQVCAFNTESDDDEIVGLNFQFINNKFTYLNTDNPGYCSPFNIYISGSPINNPTYHLIPPQSGEIIEDVLQSNSNRISEIKTYLGIDMGTDFTVSDNSYIQCWSRRFIMTATPFDVQYWNAPMETSEEDNVDLDKLVGLE